MSEEMIVEMTTRKVEQQKVMKTLGKVALWIPIALVGLVGLVLIWPSFFYPVQHAMRGIRWGSADVYDYQKFPARPVLANPYPFQFEEEPADTMVQALFEQNPAIHDLDDFLAQNQTQAFIVIQNDAILYEKYFNGASRDTIVTSFSVAKSFVSALIGTAIAGGFIQSVNDPITDYIPELAERDPAFADNHSRSIENVVWH